MENSTENNTSILSRPDMSADETPEESSWTMYFEDFFKASNVADTPTNDDCDLHRENSSLISDAASFVGMKKINFPKETSLAKKRRCKEVSLGGHDLEDTASSPSSSPDNVYSMMNLLDNNTGYKVVGDTSNGRGDVSVQDGGGLSIDLKKKGLCLVPLSMFPNYLG